MTILDKLIEVGLKCPCGGPVKIFHYKNGVEVHQGSMLDIYCPTCSANIGPSMSTLDALTARLVLTGGPVPGEVRPPRSCEVLGVWSDGQRILVSWWGDSWHYDNGHLTITIKPPDIGWYFIDRNPAVIRLWLEEEEK
jgi:hypothetical protein